jgi:F-type H+-transporting ATPase subunit epsilon
MKLIIITPEKTILEKEVFQVTVPTGAGEITILPNHADLLSTLSLGNISYKEESNDSEEFITIESGFLSTNGKDIKILADVAINSADFEQSMIEEMKQKAQKLMENSPKDKNIEKLKSQIRIADLHLSSKKRRKV